MRTAYRVWAGIAVATFCLVAALDTSSDTPEPPAAAPPAPTGTVAVVQGWANVTLADGRRLHIPGLGSAVNLADDCDSDSAMELATAMLAGKPVRLSGPRLPDADPVRGWTQTDLAVDGADYATTFAARHPTARDQRCTAPQQAAAAAPAAPAGETVTATRVIDGDTFEVGDRTIRVLGIDACEKGTWGGDIATDTTRYHLDGRQVTLTREPGVDTDRYGRELRYVTTDVGNDLGESTVTSPVVGVYAGRNDASAEYVANLRSLDADNGRSCADPGPTSSSDDSSGVYVDGGDDDDESRFCSRRRWC